MIKVNPIAFAAAAVVPVLDPVVGLTHAAIRLGHPGAMLVLLVLVDELKPRGIRHNLGEYYTPDCLAHTPGLARSAASGPGG